MSDAALSAPIPDTLSVLARANARIMLLRSWLSHSHLDEPYWWARRATAAQIQREREHLRGVAHLLHVVRATGHGRIHGTHFATVDEQRAWLAKQMLYVRMQEGHAPL